MDHPPHPSRSRAYRPYRALFAALGGIWVFVLVALGAFTTSINAGMIFPDWPLSNGSFNPTGWLHNLSMFAEHSHRLSAEVMGTVMIILAIWIWCTDSRSWLRKLAIFGVILVIFQGLLGGMRVELDKIHIDMVDTSLGRLFAMLHACVAQLFACLLLGIAASCSKGWIEKPLPVGDGIRRAGRLCCALLFIQLGIAAVMRHSFAGLAIPTFPMSTSDGHLLPGLWSFKVAINFAHRIMALVIAVALSWFYLRVWRDRRSSVGLRLGSSLMVGLVCVQIVLGATVIWSLRNPEITTAHVLVGALTLVTTFLLTWYAHRDAIESSP